MFRAMHVQWLVGVEATTWLLLYAVATVVAAFSAAFSHCKFIKCVSTALSQGIATRFHAQFYS